MAVPFLVTVRDFAAEDPARWSVLSYLEHRLDTFYQCLAAALLRHLHAVITTGQRWDPAIATRGRPSQTLIAA
jgi:hypothetical protein